jgi:uncharacterized membrane protein
MARNSEEQLIAKMSAIAVLGALSFVLTAFAKIPYAGGAGYFNFGDIIDFVAAALLGPYAGAAVGILGGSLADLFLGFPLYAPWSVLAKGLLGLTAGFLYNVLKKKKIIRFTSFFVGATFEVLAYLLCYYVLLGLPGLINSVFDCVQAFGSAIIAIPLFLALERAHLPSRFAS